MAVLEARGVVEGAELLGHGLLDFLAVVPGAAGPQAGQAVEHAAALVVDEVVAVGADDRDGEGALDVRLLSVGLGDAAEVFLEIAKLEMQS